jgi:hypothetical protein
MFDSYILVDIVIHFCTWNAEVSAVAPSLFSIVNVECLQRQIDQLKHHNTIWSQIITSHLCCFYGVKLSLLTFVAST